MRKHGSVFFIFQYLYRQPKHTIQIQLNKVLYSYFTSDHERIEVLFEKATADPDHVEKEIYHQFRTGLLKHIKMEEKILFPAAQKANGGTLLPLQAQLRLEHGALTALMVVPPTPDVIKAIRYVMTAHDRKEEEEGGMYEVCEKLTHAETDELIARLNQAEEVPVHPHNTADYALASAKRTLQRAGFDFDKIVGSRSH